MQTKAKGGEQSPPFLLSVPFVKLDTMDCIAVFKENIDCIAPWIIKKGDSLHPVKGNHTTRIAHQNSIGIEAKSNVFDIKGYFHIG